MREGGGRQIYLLQAKLYISSQGKITENYNMIPAFSFYYKPKIKKD